MPTNKKTPTHCVADFCLIPMGGNVGVSISAQIAEVQKLLEKSGLVYNMHGNGTSLEGSWDDVMKVIGQAHQMLHGQNIVRVHTDIRVGSRTDKTDSFQSKIESVETKLRGE